MALDVNLVLDPGQTVTADGNSDYVECEGGFLAWARLWTGAMSGGSTTCDIRIMASYDLGVNYYMVAGGKFQTLGPTNDNIYLAIPVAIGWPTTATNKVRVRVNYDVGGGSPSYAIVLCALDPMTSLSLPAIDLTQQTGAAALVAAT